MPNVPKLQHILKCIQNQFATEKQRAVIDSFNDVDDLCPDYPVQNQIEHKLIENGVPAGLFNIGNTCYANSALQALMTCTPLVGYFVDQFNGLNGTIEHHQRLQGNGGMKCSPFIASELSQVISTLLYLRNQNDSFSPTRLMNLFRTYYSQFTLGQQHDAQEFISCLLDRLHEELKYPVLQLVGSLEDFVEEEDGTGSSTQSDYESCLSLISEDSLYSLTEDDAMVQLDLDAACNGLARTPLIPNGQGDSLLNSAADSDEFFDSTTKDAGDATILPEVGSEATLTRSYHSHHHHHHQHQHHPRQSKIVTWRSVIQDLFYGDFAVSIECKSCGEISTRYESFQMLEVSIPTHEQMAEFDDNGIGEDEGYVNQSHKNLKGKRSSKPETSSRWTKWMSLKSQHSKRRVDLMACLKNEFKPEHLTGDNKYHCDHCHKSTDAVKNIRVSRLPEVLIIHLKRFKYENGGSFLGNFTNPDRKIHDLVDFPCDEPLDPAMFNVDSTAKFDLRCVISHTGSTLSSGHYTSYVKMGDEKMGKWYVCNDADVNEVTGFCMTDTEAYILVYTRIAPEKMEKIALLNSCLASAENQDVEPTFLAATSPRTLQLFPSNIFAHYDQNVPLISKEWWSKVKWSNLIHRLSSNDFLCPHRLLIPGTLSRLSEVCIPINPIAFEKMMELFDGMPSSRLLHRAECALCAQVLDYRTGNAK